jgi:hypothetical protein
MTILNRKPSQLSAQALHQTAESFFVAAIPSPLALLLGIDQSGLGQDGHVMGDGWLGKVYAFFDVTGAKAGVLSDCRGAGTGATLFESAEDAAPCGIGNGMESAVERCGRSHED